MPARWRSWLLLLRIVSVFGLLMGAFYTFAATELYETRIYQPYIRINTSLSGGILRLLASMSSSVTTPSTPGSSV
jgi:hypothetical protein